MRRYRLTHHTDYSYADPVDLAWHALHLRPRALPHQQVERCTITSSPAGRLEDGIDHFGNALTLLSIESRHQNFRVTAESRLIVSAPPVPAPDATQAWETIPAAAMPVAAAEQRLASPYVPLLADATGYAAECFPAGRPVLAAAKALAAAIKRDFAYRPGTTTIATPLSQVLSLRQGVCQDFAHLMIAGLRGLGLPARYVSGYIRTGNSGLTGADASHAWVSVWCGEAGWIDLDPTNDLIVADEHVTVAIGRDFGDVSPVRGVILGGGSHGLTVSVTLAEEAVSHA